MIIKNANIYQNHTRSFVFGDLRIEGEIVREVGTVTASDAETIDVEGAYIVPGMLDVHTHGRAGFDFVTCTEEQFSIMAKDYARFGVIAVMPTLASAPYEKMLRATKWTNRFEPKVDEVDFLGSHWEGRYMNPAKRGAHAPEHLAPPCAEELDSEVFRMCRALHISAAYEMDGGAEYIEKARSLGATLGLAHTTATYAQAKALEEQGITSYTHLYNAMPSLHHRDGGAVCAALEGDAYTELICDGIHIAPEMVRLAYRFKGFERLVLVSDSIEAAGCADGHYNIAGMSTVVKDGIARTEADGVLAGSTLSLDRAVNNLIDFCKIPFTEAILCATEAPARMVGVFDEYGSIDVGKKASLLFLKNPDRLEIDRVMIRGVFLNENH
jgi:N-acetylglucosamine-6-phosphate deacetylase